MNEQTYTTTKHITTLLLHSRVKTVVEQILRDDLEKRKLCLHYVPHALQTEQWQQWVPYAKDLLEMIENDPELVNSVITGNESWYFAYDPLTKWQGLVQHHVRKTSQTILILFFDS